MSLKKEFDNLKFDVRMKDINLGTKLISDEEIKSNLTGLEDSAANATQVNIDEPEEEVVQEAQATEATAPTTDSIMGSFNPNSNPFGSDSN